MFNISNLLNYYSGSLKISSILFDAKVSEADVSELTGGTSTLNSILQILGLLVLFIVIIIASFFVTRWLGSLTGGSYKNKNIKVIDTFRITSTKYIQIVCVAEKYYAIAVSKDNITLLGEVGKENIVFRDELPQVKSFKEIIDEFTKKKDDKDKTSN